jgi:hypothetical protein
MVCAFALCRLFPNPGKAASSEVFLEIVPEIRGLAAAFFPDRLHNLAALVMNCKYL